MIPRFSAASALLFSLSVLTVVPATGAEGNGASAKSSTRNARDASAPAVTRATIATPTVISNSSRKNAANFTETTIAHAQMANAQVANTPVENATSSGEASAGNESAQSANSQNANATNSDETQIANAGNSDNEVTNAPAANATDSSEIPVANAEIADENSSVEIPLTEVETAPNPETDATQNDASAPAVGEISAAENAASGAAKGRGTLTADVVRYEGGLIIAESRGDKGVVFQTPDTRVQAERVELDTVRRTLKATGKVFVERQRMEKVKPLLSDALERRNIFPNSKETVTETLRGENLNYDFGKQTGSLDNARLQLDNFTVTTDSLTINGKFYTAQNVILRPGGLSEEELRIYGTPPFSLRAKTMTVEALADAKTSGSGTSANGNAANGAPQSDVSTNENGGVGGRQARVGVKNGALYFGKTRLLPVPSFVFNQLGGSSRQPQAFTLTPRINFNSADRVLVTTQLRYGFTPNPEGAALTADLGLSQRVGFRGGVELSSPTRYGDFALGLRRSDIVTTQLTSRIELDRTPEVNYSSPRLPLFDLPGGRLAALSFSASTGKYRERLIDDDNGNSSVSTDRSSVGINLTTRGRRTGGAYLDLFARTAKYGNRDRNYSNAGFEVGYAGTLLPSVRGALSYRATTLSGDTPFRFDRVEIRRELRSTFDIEVTPRYLIPIDLRYDVSQSRLRDQTYGLLRSYKDFAYGVVYQKSRRELRLEIRQGF